MTEYEMIRNGKELTVALKETLTAADVPYLKDALKREIGLGAIVIVFDLKATDSLDSTGIGLLIATTNSLSSVQGTVRLINTSPDILKLLQSMRLVSRLNAKAPEALNG